MESQAGVNPIAAEIIDADKRDARIGKVVFQIRCEIDKYEGQGIGLIALDVARAWMMDVARSL